MSRRLLGALALALVGCAPAPHTKAAGAVASLAVKPVAWNPANAPIAKVRAVADCGELVIVLGDDGASVLSANAIVARDGSAKGWTTAVSLVAPDGTTPWLVGIDPAGKVHRLRGMTAFEDVTARYGLGDRKVRGATLAGTAKVAFLLDDRVALGSASNIAVYPTTDRLSTIAGGGDFVAGITKDAVVLVNATNAVPTRFALPGVTAAVVDARGRLHATTDRAVYAADASGALALVLDAGHDGIHGLVASGRRVWFADRGELGVVDGDRVAETSGLGLGVRATLHRSSSDDVWVIDDGKLSRYAIEGARPAERSWSATIGPVFARACASCHQPGGISGIDLSTEKAWTTKAGEVRTRVLVEKTMPPTGHALADADRAAIATWFATAR